MIPFQLLNPGGRSPRVQEPRLSVFCRPSWGSQGTPPYFHACAKWVRRIPMGWGVQPRRPTGT